MGHCLNDGVTLLCVGIGCCETLKLGDCLLPRHRASVKSLVVLFLNTQRPTVFKRDLYTARHLSGKTLAESLIRLDSYFAQQALHVFAYNALWHILCWGNVAI